MAVTVQESSAAKSKSRAKKPAIRARHPQEQHPPQHPVISFIISADTPFFRGEKAKSYVIIINPFSGIASPFSFRVAENSPQMYIIRKKLIDRRRNFMIHEQYS